MSKRTYPPLEERFWQKVDVTGKDECHEWLGMRNVVSGYGVIAESTTEATKRGRPPRLFQAHRVAYEIANGLIPDERRRWHVHHLCRNRGCVNARHLTLLDIWSHNVAHQTSPPAINAAKTHCVRGHEFTPENTRVEQGRYRKCRTCDRDRARRRAVAQKKRRQGSLQ